MIETNLSNKIRLCKDGPVNNPYQGKDKKVLFVCSMGILRSATGARLYANKYNTRSAGSYADALIPVTGVLLSWADEVVFVNVSNYTDIMDNLESDEREELSRKSIVLSIPDCYEHMHPKLQAAFHEQYEPINDFLEGLDEDE